MLCTVPWQHHSWNLDEVYHMTWRAAFFWKCDQWKFMIYTSVCHPIYFSFLFLTYLFQKLSIIFLLYHFELLVLFSWPYLITGKQIFLAIAFHIILVCYTFLHFWQVNLMILILNLFLWYLLLYPFDSL